MTASQPEQPYPTSNQRPGACGLPDRNSDQDPFSLSTSRRQPSGCPIPFEMNGYTPVDAMAYNPKSAFSAFSAASLNDSSVHPIGHGKVTSDLNSVGPRMSGRCSARNAAKSTQALAVSATSPNAGSSMMTPDSSTVGFLAQKFATSSDDGEVSPTVTNSSGTNRTRKAAPTLATGRRNLKGEPVDADEADRRMKRRERNRKSAQKCRERKVQRTQELQAQVECLQMEINRLIQERDSLRNEARQFVALLQLHCPGVAIPYMSCLNDPPETIDCLRDVCNELMQSTPTKLENLCDNVPNGWRMKANARHGPVSDKPPILTPNPTDTFSPLPTMVSLHSHIAPNRSKSSFSFIPESTERRVDDSEPGQKSLSMTNAPTAISQLPDHGIRANEAAIPMARSTSAVSARGPASASSSSSCSNYELSFPGLDSSAQPTTNQYDDIVASPVDSLSQKESITRLESPPIQSMHSGKPYSEGSAADLKCAEWEKQLPPNKLCAEAGSL
ncbi:unnamed protein product [Calicophoron daubneyi]|uniref:BZIP domain-containing protein n=1 Tax=Calicophoron daubneyi TaxID=300641 RepID=A0AAV2TE35_CALDB